MKAAAPLRLLWLSDINNSSGPRSLTTERFLQKRNATINRAPTGTGEFSLYIGNPKKTIDYFSHEADRFATAAFESLVVGDLSAEFARSTGWTLIRAYYSAFFALHSLLRLHGWACTRLSPVVTSLINKDIAGLYPESPRVESGLYFIESQSGGRELQFRKLDAVNGGSHEALWSLLETYMTRVTDVILADSSDPDAGTLLAVAIDNFLTLLKRNGGANWFTQVRNRINYSHEYGTWYPYLGSTCDVNRIKTSLSGWLLSPEELLPEKTADELIQYSTACSFLVSLCRTTIEDLTFRSVTRSPFRSSSGRLANQLRRPMAAI